MVSFSSGTEGPPKMVLLSRGNLHSAVERLTEAQGITGEIREYVAVPVHHSFGFGRGRAVLNAGGSLWLPENGFDLSEFRQMLADGQINALSAVPSQLRVLLQNLDLFGGALASVRWVEIGSQYMSADEKLRLRTALPNARIVQHYGLTEASRATLLRIDEEPAELLEAVGRVEGSPKCASARRAASRCGGPTWPPDRRRHPSAAAGAGTTGWRRAIWAGSRTARFTSSAAMTTSSIPAASSCHRTWPRAMSRAACA